MVIYGKIDKMITILAFSEFSNTPMSAPTRTVNRAIFGAVGSDAKLIILTGEGNGGKSLLHLLENPTEAPTETKGPATSDAKPESEVNEVVFGAAGPGAQVIMSDTIAKDLIGMMGKTKTHTERDPAHSDSRTVHSAVFGADAEKRPKGWEGIALPSRCQPERVDGRGARLVLHGSSSRWLTVEEYRKEQESGARICAHMPGKGFHKEHVCGAPATVTDGTPFRWRCSAHLNEIPHVERKTV